MTFTCSSGVTIDRAGEESLLTSLMKLSYHLVKNTPVWLLTDPNITCEEAMITDAFLTATPEWSSRSYGK